MTSKRRGGSPLWKWLTGVAALGMMSTSATPAVAVPVIYSSEAAYLAAISGCTAVQEGFEEAVWTPCVSGCGSLANQGITWSGSDLIRIGVGWVRSGAFGVFDSFGDPDRILAANSVDTLVGVGGWFRSSDAPSITFLLDGVAVVSLDLISTHQFLGIVDLAGFNAVSVEAPSGHWGADDFTFARAAVPEPGTVLLLGLGVAGLFLRSWRRPA